MYVRVFERPGLSQDIEEQKREIKELGSRLALAKEKIEKPFNSFLGEVLPQGVLKRDKSLEDSDDLPAPDVLAQEIADDLQTALEQFTVIAEKVKS